MAQAADAKADPNFRVLRSSRAPIRAGHVSTAVATRTQLQEQQFNLRRLKLAELRERFCEGTNANSQGGLDQLMQPRGCCAYDSPDSLPDIRSQVRLDLAAEALIVPIFGSVVPFHVRTIQ